MRWCEISGRPSRERYTALSELMTEQGVENQVEFITATEEDFESVATQAMRDFAQIRVGRDLMRDALRVGVQMPSLQLNLRAADCLAKDRQGKWWPRCFLADGITRVFADSGLSVDLSGDVFIVGANAETRAVVASLSRIGFARFTIAHSTDEPTEALVDELKSIFFGAQIRALPRALTTQLPGIFSAAVNTLVQGEDDGFLAELTFFNFLRVGGVWLDLVLVPPNDALSIDAGSLGAHVFPGSFVAAATDVIWLEKVCDIKVEFESLASRYQDVAKAASADATNP